MDEMNADKEDGLKISFFHLRVSCSSAICLGSGVSS